MIFMRLLGGFGAIYTSKAISEMVKVINDVKVILWIEDIYLGFLMDKANIKFKGLDKKR